MKLIPEYTAAFGRDVKRLRRKHVGLVPLIEVINLVCANTAESREELRRRHRMHRLFGAWSGSHECHIANAGDWLLIWREGNGVSVFERTGSHDELFR